ncbi:hypothetical protein QMY50_00214 (plasmid) [Escherichia coli]|nr:hypothetical protein QMY50_00214 [Escherichia coli]
MDTGLSEVLVFKLFRTEAATPTVPPPPIVITFDIIKYRCPHYFPADKVFSMDTFHFQRMKEAGFAPIFPDTCYHLTHYWPAAVDIPVASDNPVHYADAIRYNARTPLQGSLLPLTRLVWA